MPVPGVKDEKICAVVPSYNAAFTLRKLLADLACFCPAVVVDDGSEDETFRIAEDFCDQGVVLLRHEKRLGKGAALRTGFFWAIEKGFDVVATLDSDLQHDPQELPGMLKVFVREQLDLLVGSRRHAFFKMPRTRRFGNWFSSWIASMFCHHPIEDSQCGYRIYRLESFTPLIMNIRLNRFDAETDIILKAALRRLHIGFTPIKVIYPDDEFHVSHYRSFRDTALIIWLYVREICRRTFTQRGRKEVRKVKRETRQHSSGTGIPCERASSHFPPAAEDPRFTLG